jgi:serine protease
MAAFLYRFAGKPTLPNTTSFVDVPPGAQFHEEISWLGSAEISTGWDEGNG